MGGQQPAGGVSLATYATLLAHLRYFPKELSDEVLQRLDFDPGCWSDFAHRSEQQLAAAIKAKQSTAEFDDVYGALRRKLKRRAPSVDDLPLDAEKPAGDSGPARSMRLRDLDPVQFLEILSARLPHIEVVPHGADAARVAPDPFASNPAPPPLVQVPTPLRAAGAAEEARRRSQEAKRIFENTQVSPSVPARSADAPPNVTVRVAPRKFPKEPGEVDVDVDVDVVWEPEPAAPNPHTLQIEQAAFPVLPLQLSLFEFANLCAEYNQCPAASREQVRQKYGLAGEADRLAQLDSWRERLVMDPAQLAEWRKLYDAAMRHWHQIYQG